MLILNLHNISPLSQPTMTNFLLQMSIEETLTVGGNLKEPMLLLYINPVNRNY